MPKIKSYTPAWLSSPSPGHDLFTPNPDEAQHVSSYASKSALKSGPRRTIARRGTEVYIAVGKEIRWADLVYLKERWQEKAARGRAGVRVKREDSSEPSDNDLIKDSIEDGCAEGFRTIKTSVGSDIQQLAISPYANFIAVLTTHTVRIILLPDPSHLTAPSLDVIKPKSWTLGPTTHVMDRSPIASSLWHPLGVNGSALVTVTKDALVRVWELSQKDRWSFDTPSLTIDLQKLADGTSLDQNFGASSDITNKGFSPDSFEMDVAAACFAGRGSGGWSPMTLWIAMREGDVYALCPLLPSQWAPPPILIPSLSISIVGNLAAIEDDPGVSEQAKLLAQQQLDWMSDLDNQEPRVVEGPPGEAPTEIYARPMRPGIVPRLQGPFDLELSPYNTDDLDIELTDIFAIGEKLDTDELMMGEDDDLEMEDIDGEGLSLSVICLLSSSGQLRICLDLDGVQAQWLPPRNKSKAMGRLVGSPSLLTFQSLDVLNAVEVTEDGWPVFSPDVTSRYSFFITHSSSITSVSLPWVFRLESELQGDSQAGSDFRIDLLVKGQSSTRERLYTSPSQVDTQLQLSAAVAIRDPDLGYFLLSATPFVPIAITFEVPQDDFAPPRPASPSFSKDAEVQPLDFFEPRPVFQPSHAFDQRSNLPELLDRLRTSRHKTVVNQEVRLSPLTLQLFTEVHQILSDETHRLGVAASEVFRRCVKLQGELRQQITKANEVKARVEAVTGEDQGEDGEPEPSNAAIERRLQAAKEKGEALSQRLEKMRRKVNKATSRELSAREEAWMDEVRKYDASIMGSARPADGAGRAKQAMHRYQEVMQLKDELAEQAYKLGATDDGEENLSASTTDLRIPSELRRAKVNQVKGLLERETALVDAVKARLERLAVVG
ncbi:Uu.00g003020.m01.CDS01 [Anthostomella pinea]|uniref:Uu.00g003020.m01.CDS01 n=1 Tax=Anthostomella pinea TaxID=933095 RepID=A0AAI8VKA3_9PEZI|nr:Uu.00g003020.m01.CDS01 [Anthostomella pinea]